jgi:hypothetical protein
MNSFFLSARLPFQDHHITSEYFLLLPRTLGLLCSSETEKSESIILHKIKNNEPHNIPTAENCISRTAFAVSYKLDFRLLNRHSSQTVLERTTLGGFQSQNNIRIYL